MAIFPQRLTIYLYSAHRALSFIKDKRVKTAKITQMILWFPRFYATKTTGNSQRRYRPHAWTV